jgi:hypothetical protein
MWKSCIAFITVLELISSPSVSANALQCGDPLPSAAAQGTFTRIPLDDPCTKTEPLWFTLGSIGTTPLFTAKISDNGDCGWSISTIADAAIRPLTPPVEELAEFAAAPDGSFWAISESAYVHIRTDGKRDIVPKSGSEYQPASISIDGDGRVYGIESNGGPSPLPLRLVDLISHAFSQLDPGAPTDIRRGLDGNLYLTVFNGPACLSYRIVAGIASKMSGCHANAAVTAAGTMWEPSHIGVLHVRSDGSATPIAIPAFPCKTNSNTAESQTRSVVAEPNGAWFIYRGLWHVLPSGALSSIAFPAGFHPDTMIGTTDGTLWLIAGSDGMQPTVLYEFQPRP